MSLESEQKRKRAVPPKPALSNKKMRRAAAYHSSSSEEDEAAPLKNRAVAKKVAALDDAQNDFVVDEDDAHLDGKADANGGGVSLSSKSKEHGVDGEQRVDSQSPSSDADEGEKEIDSTSLGSDSDSDASISQDHKPNASSASTTKSKKPPTKRHDPNTFSTSINTILTGKLTRTQRSDPILSRSKSAADTSKQLADSKLEAKAKRRMKEDKRTQQERGRVRDVLGTRDPGVSTGEVVEREKQLRRMAQRGVVKLFNAVKAAQMKGEEERRKGVEDMGGSRTVGMDSRKERVNEMSKKGFLDLLVDGGGRKGGG